MDGAKAPESRLYWIRYIVAFWAIEKLKWARDNVLIACLCSVAPGLIAAGIGAALSDHEWRAATRAVFLTYGGLFVLFLVWRVVATPWELDRETQRFITRLADRLAQTRSTLAALRASTPAIQAEILEFHVQAADAAIAPQAPGSTIDREIFLWVKLTLREPRWVGALEYELRCVLHGNTMRADRVDDIQDWGLVTERERVGIGTTFRYRVARLTKIAYEIEQRGVPVEGWLHFRAYRMHEKEVGATLYRFTVLTPNGGITTDIAGAKDSAQWGEKRFQRIPSVTTANFVC